ncbi:hypothetical protein [Paenibacillus thalictri]|uniref:Cadherin domain-containing protein n=1 Tax=Paenibacillus thalictri TaxID=2527873 RepID=A0A4Q9DL56_9BACL|nr:hypothetical protein [Paenibacillus thalictri]TBL75103.1 hypothetical protein EYB31_24140 [Paenibacillus thalictri]
MKLLSGKSSIPKTLSMLMAVSTLVAAPPLYASAQSGQTFATLGDKIGLPGETLVIDLAAALGTAGSYQFSEEGTSYVSAKISGSMLHLLLLQPGKAVFTVSGANLTASSTFSVYVLDAGTDGRLDIGDVRNFAANNPGTNYSSSDIGTLLSSVEPVVLPKAVPPTVVSATYEMYIRTESIPAVPLSRFFSLSESLEFSISPSSAGGVSARIENNSVVFQGSPVGAASFSVKAKNTSGASSTAVVSIIPNRPPTVTTSTYIAYALPGTTPASFNVSSYFSDPDGDPLTYSVTPPSVNGISALIASSSVLLFSGALSSTSTSSSTFAVTAADNSGASATMIYTIVPGSAPVNHAPVAQSVSKNVYYYYNSTGVFPTVRLTDNFSDPDGNMLAYSFSSGAIQTSTIQLGSAGNPVTALIDQNTGTLSFSSPKDGSALLSNGPVTFAVTAKDPAGLSATTTYSFVPTFARKENIVYSRSQTIYLDDNFTLPDYSNLTYTFSNVVGAASVSLISGGVSISGMSSGSTATFTVTAQNQNGNKASANYTVLSDTNPIHEVYSEETRYFTPDDLWHMSVPLDAGSLFTGATGLTYEVTDVTFSVGDGAYLSDGNKAVLTSGGTVFFYGEAISYITDLNDINGIELNVRATAPNGLFKDNYIYYAKPLPEQYLTIPDQYKLSTTLTSGAVVDLNAAFDTTVPLIYTVEEKNDYNNLLTVNPSNLVNINATASPSLATGSSVVTVTAMDGLGRTFSHDFTFEPTIFDTKPADKQLMPGSTLTLHDMTWRYEVESGTGASEVTAVAAPNNPSFELTYDSSSEDATVFVNSSGYLTNTPVPVKVTGTYTQRECINGYPECSGDNVRWIPVGFIDQFNVLVTGSYYSGMDGPYPVKWIPSPFGDAYENEAQEYYNEDTGLTVTSGDAQAEAYISGSLNITILQEGSGVSSFQLKTYFDSDMNIMPATEYNIPYPLTGTVQGPQGPA